MCVSHQGAERPPWPSCHHLLFCYLKHPFWAVGLESPHYVWRPKHDHISRSINFLENGLLGLQIYFHPSDSQGILLWGLSYTFAGNYIQPLAIQPIYSSKCECLQLIPSAFQLHLSSLSSYRTDSSRYSMQPGLWVHQFIVICYHNRLTFVFCWPFHPCDMSHLLGQSLKQQWPFDR